jgi:lipid-A-disaccharide synthase
MEAIRELRPATRFGGAGGARMQSLCEAPFDLWIQRAAVVGLWDVLKNYGYFRAKFHAHLRSISELHPDAVVLVDYPGFNLRLARALRSKGYRGKILHYISPQVWAWNRSRIPRMAKILDLVICVFPFEAPMYEASGLHTVFVGHPLLEALAAKRGGVERESSLLGLFPGSREREVRRIFPAMLEAARIVAEKNPHTRFEAAAAGPARAAMMRQMAEGFPVRIVEGDAHGLMQRATAGLVCSGTACGRGNFDTPWRPTPSSAWNRRWRISGAPAACSRRAKHSREVLPGGIALAAAASLSHSPCSSTRVSAGPGSDGDRRRLSRPAHGRDINAAILP